MGNAASDRTVIQMTAKKTGVDLVTDKPWAPFGPVLLEYDCVYSLAGSLQISQVEAAGFVALVIAFAIANADDYGRIDDFTDKAIESACYWSGERGELVKAFAANGVLEGERDSDDKPLRIETGLWATVAWGAIKKRIEARNRKRKERERKRAAAEGNKS